MFQIGNIKVKNRFVLAPLSGISNSAFRRIVKEMGCGLVYAEMVSDKAIVYQNEKTIDMLYMTERERPLAQQIFGSDVNSFVKAAQYVYKTMKPDIIDINMGCPVPKVALRSQAGSALLKDVNKIYEIVSAVVKSVPLPVTVKIRSGWDQNNINAVEVAQICEKAGVQAITVHGRTRQQGYKGEVDLEIIKKVKESVSLPVIGNGDIKSCYDAKRMLDFTNCDAVMIGRGALGNPWIFKECLAYMKDNTAPSLISKDEKIKMMKKHIGYLLEQKPEKIVVLEMRSHLSWYLKGIPGSVNLKRKIMTITKVKELYKLLDKFKEESYG